MWQKCPICNGEGCDTLTSTICSVCNGMKIISTVTGLPPERVNIPNKTTALGHQGVFSTTYGNSITYCNNETLVSYD